MKRTGGEAFKTAFGVLSMAAAFATPAVAGSVTAPSSDWTVTIGAEGRAMPRFDGSDNLVLRPVPIFRIRRAGTHDRFRSPRDGGGFALFDAGALKAGPAVKLRYARKEGDDSDLRGLGDVDWTFEAGAFAEFWPSDWLRTRVEVRKGFGGHRGVVADLSSDLVVPVAPKLTLSGGPRMTLASTAAVDPYFSITAAQSAASGLAVYEASGGLRSYGVGAQARYAWSAQWGTHFFVEYERLTGDAADSPLVTQRGSRDQIQVGIGATYSFDVPGLW